MKKSKIVEVSSVKVFLKAWDLKVTICKALRVLKGGQKIENDYNLSKFIFKRVQRRNDK